MYFTERRSGKDRRVAEANPGQERTDIVDRRANPAPVRRMDGAYASMWLPQTPRESSRTHSRDNTADD